MRNDIGSNKIIWGALLALMLLNVVSYYDVATRLYQFRWQWMDFNGQWAICAYTLHGVDPYPLVGAETPLIDEIGTIKKNWGTSPYGCLIGNIFYAGFLPMEQAKIYFLIASVAMIMVTAFFFYRYFERSKFGLIAAGLVLTSFAAYGSIYSGNAGVMVCCLLMISCLICDSSPIAAGVLLSLAMLKPQTALPICFAFLFMKKFKPVIIAAAIDVICWFIVSIMVDKTVLGLLDEFLHSHIGGKSHFAGLFTLAFPDSLETAMFLSMIFGVVFIFVLMRRLQGTSTLTKFYPACLTPAFFGYSFNNELSLLLLPIILLARLSLSSDEWQAQFKWLTALIFCSIMPIVSVYLLYILIELGFAQVMVFWNLRTIFAIGLILIGILMSRADFD